METGSGSRNGILHGHVSKLLDLEFVGSVARLGAYFVYIYVFGSRSPLLHYFACDLLCPHKSGAFMRGDLIWST